MHTCLLAKFTEVYEYMCVSVCMYIYIYIYIYIYKIISNFIFD